MSASSSKSQWIYDVFLSFRGKDTRRSFVSHLHAALSNVGVNAFLDDEKLHKGHKLGPELMRAIEGSQICVVVFSKRYVESVWCLDELVKIMECHRTNGQVVLPVFYDVDPKLVRGGAGIHHLANMYGDTEIWKKAMFDAANLTGWDVKNYRSEYQLVTDIVSTILNRLDQQSMPMTDFPVGLDSHIQDLIKFFKEKSKRVCIIGIWGMGGIGKTTVAKAIYNKMHREFEHKCFLANIRELWEKDRGRIDLQEQLLSDILSRNMKIHSTEWGKRTINNELLGKKVLVVLDDVNEAEQLKALCGNGQSIGIGSVIIVTTRDARSLNEINVDRVHQMNVMDENESLELFSWHAFRHSSPRQDLIEVSRNIAGYCEGLPLALEVLGSGLYNRTNEVWGDVWSKLQKIPHSKIQEKLRISYDGLMDDTMQDIFLDICCFFIGKDRAFVTQILDGCEFQAKVGITVLIERSLINVEKNNKLGMHSLLRDMGREIVRESSRKEPENQSRLWSHEDTLRVLTEKSGTKAIEGLALKLQQNNKRCCSTGAFEKMTRLRLLQLEYVQLTGDFGYLSKHLSWVAWKGFPSKYTPDNFDLGKAVVIELKHSNLKKVWKKPQCLQMLKILNLSHSLYLTQAPDFSNIPNLERLIFKGCRRLCKVHESIGNLRKLLLIDLTDCTSLSNLPRIIYELKSLKTLILSGCSKIDKLEEDIVRMESLTTLIADNTAVTQAPFSIVEAKSIAYISLCGFEGFARDVFPLLISSWISPTMDPVAHIHSFGSMSSSPVFIDVQNNNFSDLSPMFSNLSKIRTVWVQCDSVYQLTQELRRLLDGAYDSNFSDLETASNLLASQISADPLDFLLIGMGDYHEVYNALRDIISKEPSTKCFDAFSSLSDNHPYWRYHCSEGQSILFDVPNADDCRMKGMTLCIPYSSTCESMAAECLIRVLMVNYTRFTIQIYRRDTTISFSDEVWQHIISSLEPGDKVEIFIILAHGLTVKKTAVYLICDQSSNLKSVSSPKQKKHAFTRLINKMSKLAPK